jgi:DNA modification methylase
LGGSGTGLIAAEQTGRRAIVIELDPAYVDVILMRFSKHTGNTPVREADGEPFRDVTAPDGA